MCQDLVNTQQYDVAAKNRVTFFIRSVSSLTQFHSMMRLNIDNRHCRIWAIALLSLLATSVVQASQPLEEIRHVAEQHALQLALSERLNNPTIKAGRLDPRLTLARCSEPLTSFDNTYGPIGQRLTVGVRCEGEKPWTVYVPIKVEATIRVVTLGTSLSRGTVLKADHLTYVLHTRRSAATPHLSRMDQAVGQELTRSIGAGIPLTTAMVKKPDLVTKGDSVMMIIERGTIRVSMIGKALENGALGERIRLNNVNSNRAVEGEVQSDGSIRVL